jgi:hypothetical protein
MMPEPVETACLPEAARPRMKQVARLPDSRWKTRASNMPCSSQFSKDRRPQHMRQLPSACRAALRVRIAQAVCSEMTIFFPETFIVHFLIEV